MSLFHLRFLASEVIFLLEISNLLLLEEGELKREGGREICSFQPISLAFPCFPSSVLLEISSAKANVGTGWWWWFRWW